MTPDLDHLAYVVKAACTVAYAVGVGLALAGIVWSVVILTVTSGGVLAANLLTDHRTR